MFLPTAHFYLLQTGEVVAIKKIRVGEKGEARPSGRKRHLEAAANALVPDAAIPLHAAAPTSLCNLFLRSECAALLCEQ